MSSFDRIAENSSTICVGAIAVALGDPSGGTLAATGMAGLGVLGLSLRRSSAKRACDAAAKQTLAALKTFPEFAKADLIRAQTLLEDVHSTGTITTEDLRAAYKKADDPARAEALADILHARLPFDGDTDLTKRLLKLALRASMRAALPHVEDQAIRELVVQIARDSDGMVTVLARVEDKVDEVLRRQGGIEAILNTLTTQNAEDLRIIAKAFGETDLTAKADLIVFLTKKGDEYLAYQTQIDHLDDRVAAIANLKGAAQDAAKRLDFDEVEMLLSRVDEVETEIAAETKLARASNALLRNRAEDAFRILSAAADSFAALDPLESARRRRAYSKLLYAHGLRYGGSEMDLSARMLRNALDRLPKENAAELWGALQNSLAVVCSQQGIRTAGSEGTQLLADAVDAYQEALTIYTKADHPVQWAMTQNNLAAALQEQGIRTAGPDGTQLLADAVTTYHNALTIFTKADHPVDWAITQNNLANPLQQQGIRTAGPEGAQLVAEAITACQKALTILKKADHPMQWAMTQNNLATALQQQGICTAGPEGAQLLAEAVSAYHNALTIYTKADHPVDWAMTQNNLAIALSEQGIRTAGPDGAQLLAEAVTAHQKALTIRTKADHPVHWAMTQNNLAVALKEQGIRTAGRDGAQLLADAVTAYQNALTIYTQADYPVKWAMTQENLANLEEARADHDTTGDPIPHLRAALTHVDAALTVYDPEHMPFNHNTAIALRDRLRTRLGL